MVETIYGERKSCSVLDQQKLGDRARLLRLERCFDFIPGQSLGLSLGESLAPRRYSIASGTKDPWFDVLYTLVEGGELTPQLFQLAAGDRAYVFSPIGSFFDRKPAIASGRIWWIANGTGIAPFASFFRSGRAENRILLHGIRARSEAYFEDEFLREQKLSYRSFVTGSEEAWHRGVRKGRLSTWLRTEGLEEIQKDDYFMLCGSAGMVVEVREILMKAGISHGHIDSEIYF
ncbi:ferredoxin--NADP reductase [Treponema sp.]